MKDIVNKTTAPPRPGWTYTDPRTGITFKDNSLNALYPAIAMAWNANGIEFPENWKAVVNHEMCEQNPHIECREIGEPERTVTLDDVTRFGATVKNWLASGGGFVPKEESERRAAICIKCHDNKPVGICWSCRKALTWIGERVGWPETSVDSQLQNCNRCACILRLKVHMPLDVIDSTGINWPDHCWQKVTPSSPPV